MYQKAKYFSGKFIRNGFGSLGLSLVFMAGNSVNSFQVMFLFIALSAGWLFLGFRFKKKLKQKSESEEETFSKSNYKWTESILRLSLVILILLSLKEAPYANIAAILIGLGYITWLIKQSILIEKYLKSSPNEPLQNIH